MYNGDRSRKKSLIDYGFRLPSAYDNRPLKFHEFEQYMGNVIFVSATPGDYELKKSGTAGRADHPPDRPRRPERGSAADRGPDRRHHP